MIGRRGLGDLPQSHSVARTALGGFVALLFLAALALAVYLAGDELALARIMEDAVKSRLLP